MRYSIYLLGFSFFFLLNCEGGSAQNKESSIEKNPYFWTAKKEGKTHHLLGTIHLGLDLEDLPCSETVKNRLQNSRLLLTEIDLALEQTEKTSQNQQQQILSDILKREESAFWKSLTEERKNLLLQRYESNRPHIQIPSENIKEVVKRLGGDEVSFNLFVFCLETQEQQTVPVLDHQIYQLAGEYSVDRAGLSAKEEQMQTMFRVLQIQQDFIASNLTEEIFKESLLKAIDNFDAFCSNLKSEFKKGNQILTETVKAYKEGSLNIDILISRQLQDFLAKFSQYNIPQSKKSAFKKDYKKIFNQKVLKERNEKWLSQIVSAHQKYDSLFIAVGAAHFIGEYDILNKLKKEGFEIKRFSPQCEEK